MELEVLKRGLAHLKEKGVVVSGLVTDRHTRKENNNKEIHFENKNKEIQSTAHY